MDVQGTVWTIAADATETYFASDAARIGLPCYLYVLPAGERWDGVLRLALMTRGFDSRQALTAWLAGKAQRLPILAWYGGG